MDCYELDLKLPNDRPQFLFGPVCLNWLAKTSKIPGKALHVAIVLLHTGRVTGNPSWVKVKPSLLKKFGVHRNSAYRAIEAMELAGLIRVKQRRQGSAAIVSLEKHIPHGMSWSKEEVL